MSDWSIEDETERVRLLAICKNNSGEYLPAHHGKGSWATTYSNKFIDASVELWKLHIKNGAYFPQYAMARDFQSEGIHSCRYVTMTSERVEYLYKVHIRDRI